MKSPENLAKRAAGKAAASLIQDGMRIGLGTGSTAAYFIESLVQRFSQGLKISAVASSKESERQALAGGIPFCDINTITSLDVTVDGADEIDDQKCMIKGGGGALLREKIIASMSKEMIVIIDEHKLVKHLGKFPLPVEIVPFAPAAIIHNIQQKGFQGQMRHGLDGQTYYTDNGNLIFDIKCTTPLTEPESLYVLLKSIPGVVEVGIFCNLAGRVIIGYDSGQVEIKD
jgi:ribose 5-phosphate isomerase A